MATMVLGSLSHAATVKLAPIMVGDITTFVPYLPAPIETLHATYHPDETVSVQVNIPLSGDHDWAGVFRVGDSSDRSNAIAWNWVSGDTTILDRGRKPMPAGEYEVRLFFHNSTHVEAMYRFTVQNRPQAHDLNIMIAASGSGATITSLKSHGTELAETGSKFFDLTLKNLDNNTFSHITSSAGWGSVSLHKTGEEYAIDFANPQDNTLPQTLAVSMHIVINNGNASQWDMNVTGIGAHHSLVNVRAPELHLRMKPNAKLLLPKYSGLLRDVNDSFSIDDVDVSSPKDHALTYPAGWEATMQFSAYYANQFGLYLATHDPHAALKKFYYAKEANALVYGVEIVPPDKTLPDNTFHFPGHFELDSFSGDWFDASKHYLAWAQTHADYFPHMTPQRINRQHKIGEIALWGACQLITEIEKMPEGERKENRRRHYLEEVSRYMGQLSDYYQGIPVGIIWNEWYGKVMDWDYPNVFFPANAQAIKDAMIQVKNDHPNLRLMPYTNGFIHDMESGSYGAEAQAAAAKQEDGSEYVQHWNQDDFAIMDPSQTFWQNKIRSVANNVLNTLGADGIYIDQVTASTPRQDMDPNHQHPLAGGSWWRAGYDGMFDSIDALGGRDEKFVTSEAAAEYMLDHMDGQFLHGWAINSLVPAYQVVYGGRVQLFGLRNTTSVSQANQDRYGLDKSEYNNDAYYVKGAVMLTSGIQIGSVPTSWFVQNPDTQAEARDYVTKLVHTRYKFRDFLSYGSIQRPMPISGNVPSITSWWRDYGTYHRVTKKAIQHSIYRSGDGQKTAFFFVNASRDQTIDFSFQCDPTNYGFAQSAGLHKYTMNVDDTNVTWHRTSVTSGEVQVTLAPLDVVIFVLGE